MTAQEFLNAPRGALIKYNEGEFKGCVILMDHPGDPRWRQIRYMKFSYLAGQPNSYHHAAGWRGFVNIETTYHIELWSHEDQLIKAQRVA